MGSVTTRDAALHQRLKCDAHADRLRRRRQRRRARCCARCRRCALRYAAQDRAGRELAAWWASRPEVVAGAASGARRARPGTSTGRALCSAGRRAVLGRLRRALRARAGRRLRRCAAAVPDRLLVGRAGQPGRPLRPGGDAREAGAGAGTLVRFSIGLEAVEDLIEDCRAGAAGARRQLTRPSPGARVVSAGGAGASSGRSGAIVNDSSLRPARRRCARADALDVEAAEQRPPAPSSSRASPGGGRGRRAARRRRASRPGWPRPRRGPPSASSQRSGRKLRRVGEVVLAQRCRCA